MKQTEIGKENKTKIPKGDKGHKGTHSIKLEEGNVLKVSAEEKWESAEREESRWI